MLKYDIRFQDPYWIITITGNLLEKQVTPLKSLLATQLEQGHMYVAIDLSRVTQACSLALGILVKAWKQFTAVNGKLVILNPTQELNTLFEETKLSNVIPLYQSENDLPT